MKSALTSPEQAYSLEHLGFPVSSLEIYDETYRNGEPIPVPDDCYVSQNYYIRERPSLEIAAKWFRDEKKVYISVIYEKHITDKNFEVQVNEKTLLFESCPGYWYPIYYDTYEEALSAGIDRAIEKKNTLS